MQRSFSLQHLDIKPENLLILSGRVKVADFGLVKDIQDTTVSLVGGLTPVYAAPEVFSGHPSLHSDEYTPGHCLPGNADGRLAVLRTEPCAARHAAPSASAPRLAPLPPGDRSAIARALAGTRKTAFHRAAN